MQGRSFRGDVPLVLTAIDSDRRPDGCVCVMSETHKRGPERTFIGICRDNRGQCI